MKSIPDFYFHHGGVSVPSLDEAIAWYRDMLGFELERQFPIPPANAEAAMIRRGNQRFELFEVANAKDLPDDRRYPNRDLATHGNKHVAFRVNDMESFLVTLEAQGADIAMVVRENHGKGFFVRDCAGNLIEFVEE